MRTLVCFAAILALDSAVFAQDKPPRERPDTKTNRLLNELEQEYKAGGFKDPWAQRLKELIELGPDAVPDLIAELDATDSDMMLRNLGFSLRAIGDKRAVPALIRNFPKTLKKPGSDMGVTAEDKDLLAFMQKHDLDEKDRDKYYGFGRPVREIGGALQKLTGQKLGEEEIFGVFLQGGPHQQRMQKLLYRRCAERWAGWWAENWENHLTDKKYASAGLPNGDATVAQTFPQGPTVKLAGASSGHIAEADEDLQSKHEVFYDLDTGRRLALPKFLAELKDDPHRLDKIQSWAAREGFDLMGTLYRAPDRPQPYYAIRGLGLTAWEIGADQFQSLSALIGKEEPLPAGQPAGGLLLHCDEKTGRYDPAANATFLFVTREGTYGALFVGVEVLDTDMSARIGRPASGDPALDPVGFYKGRRFSVKIVEPAQ